MLLLIDNYDSFTWNLVQRLAEIDRSLHIEVVRNDKITPDEVRRLAPSHIIISPGPCTPLEAGISNDIIKSFAGIVPILGVCLGHQCIGHTHGMVVLRHARIVHGKTSEIHHDGRGVFAGLPNPFTATRYHSLVILRDSIPQSGAWEVSAWTTDTLDDGTTQEVVMGLRRAYPPEPPPPESPEAPDSPQTSETPKNAPLEGVQFHPESFLTEHGPTLLANFLRFTPGRVASGV